MGNNTYVKIWELVCLALCATGCESAAPGAGETLVGGGGGMSEPKDDGQNGDGDGDGDDDDDQPADCRQPLRDALAGPWDIERPSPSSTPATCGEQDSDEPCIAGCEDFVEAVRVEDQFPITGSDSRWAGELVTLANDGSLVPWAKLDRAELELSVFGEIVTVEKPSLSTYRAATGALLTAGREMGPASTTVNLKHYSTRGLLELDFGPDHSIVDAMSGLEGTHTFVLTVESLGGTIESLAPNPFASSVCGEDLTDEVVLAVQRLRYGGKAVMMFESTEPVEDIRIQLQTAINESTEEGQLSAESEQVLSQWHVETVGAFTSTCSIDDSEGACVAQNIRDALASFTPYQARLLDLSGEPIVRTWTTRTYDPPCRPEPEVDPLPSPENPAVPDDA